MRYQFIREHREQFRIGTMCKVLGVSRSGYHAWLDRPRSERSQQNARLLEEIREIHRESRQTYGSPRVYAELRRRGKTCGRHRVARLMRLNDVRVHHRRRYRVTTDSRHNLPVAENLLGRHFEVGAANRAWVADITYVPTAQGWLYLATVLDLGTRQVVGWSMGTTMERGLVIRALEMAISGCQPAPGLIHHSDRGSQYASHDYQRLLKEHGMLPSMSRKGDCWDNAVMESFFHTLKTELIGNRVFRTRGEARVEIFRYIETWYNRKRLHSALGYMAPDEYESLVGAV
jgi:transposase InsO family protein